MTATMTILFMNQSGNSCRNSYSTTARVHTSLFDQPFFSLLRINPFLHFLKRAGSGNHPFPCVLEELGLMYGYGGYENANGNGNGRFAAHF